MFQIQLSKAVRRALGEGVSRLHDGDLRDRDKANEVLREMSHLGFVYEGSGFIHKNEILLISHLHEQGSANADLTDEEKAQVQGLIEDNPELLKLYASGAFSDLPEIVVQALAEKIRTLRHRKGLRFEPV
jgi:hypothetical protein